MKYRAMVRTQLAASVGQKPTPARSMPGSTRNIGRDGRTYQNVDSAWPAIRSASPVSRHSQMIPSNETSGSETINAPNAGLRFATSETTAMITPDNAHLMTKYSIPRVSLLTRLSLALASNTLHPPRRMLVDREAVALAF